MTTEPTCLHCGYLEHPALLRGDGYCLGCRNAGVPDLLDSIETLRAALKPFDDMRARIPAQVPDDAVLREDERDRIHDTWHRATVGDLRRATVAMKATEKETK